MVKNLSIIYLVVPGEDDVAQAAHADQLHSEAEVVSLE